MTGAFRLACGCLVFYPGVPQALASEVLCGRCARWTRVQYYYRRSGCSSVGRLTAKPGYPLYCTLGKVHSGDHHDEVEGLTFPAVHLRSSCEGNTGRRP